MGTCRLAEDDELTVAAADYGRRLNPDRFREPQTRRLHPAKLQSRTFIEVASACANEGFHVLRRAMPRL